MESEESKQGEVKKVVPQKDKASPPRDPSMTGGERGQTPEENAKDRARKNEPKEPPIIQKDVT